MNNSEKNIQDLLGLFEDLVSPEEAVFAKLSAEMCSALSKERLKKHMTQSEFAAFLGVQQSQVSKWEHGGENFSLRTLSKLAAKLNWNLNIDILNKKELPSVAAANKFVSTGQFTRTVHIANTSQVHSRMIREFNRKEIATIC